MFLTLLAAFLASAIVWPRPLVNSLSSRLVLSLNPFPPSSNLFLQFLPMDLSVAQATGIDAPYSSFRGLRNGFLPAPPSYGPYSLPLSSPGTLMRIV